MATLIHLDTHVVAWLYAGRFDLLPDAVKDLLNTHELGISPMARLELQYLYEIDRLATPAAAIVDELASAIGLVLCAEPFHAVVAEAERQSWTRDPFDRLIVAQSAYSGSTLVTRDQRILEHYAHAVWR